MAQDHCHSVRPLVTANEIHWLQVDKGSLDKDEGIDATTHTFTVDNDAARFIGYLFAPNPAPLKRMLVLFLPGSGWQSVQGFAHRKLVPFVHKEAIYIATIDHIGVEPGASIREKPSDIFFAYDDKGSRVTCTLTWLNWIIEQYGPFDHVGLIGYSEGADIAARAARLHPGIKSIVLLGGSGYPAIDEIRLGLHKSLTTGCAIIDHYLHLIVDLYLRWQVRRILHAPTKHRRFLGLSFRRWWSYALEAPIDDLLSAALKVRILAIHGELDVNVPVEAAIYIEQRFQDAQQSGFQLKVHAGLDHNFRDPAGADHLPIVLAEAMDWITGHTASDSPSRCSQ